MCVLLLTAAALDDHQWAKSLSLSHCQPQRATIRSLLPIPQHTVAPADVATYRTRYLLSSSPHVRLDRHHPALAARHDCGTAHVVHYHKYLHIPRFTVFDPKTGNKKSYVNEQKYQLCYADIRVQGMYDPPMGRWGGTGVEGTGHTVVCTHHAIAAAINNLTTIDAHTHTTCM